jgi:hypothetical protein
LEPTGPARRRSSSATLVAFTGVPSIATSSSPISTSAFAADEPGATPTTTGDAS